MRPLQYLVNMDAEEIRVFHRFALQRSGESAYRSHCPKCGVGLLLVRRNQQTMQLLRRDRCTSCAQAFYYMDDAINDEPLADA